MTDKSADFVADVAQELLRDFDEREWAEDLLDRTIKRQHRGSPLVPEDAPPERQNVGEVAMMIAEHHQMVLETTADIGETALSQGEHE